MIAELFELSEDSDPGAYEVETRTGSVYLVTINPDRPTMISRRSLVTSLYGGSAPMAVSNFRFSVPSGGGMYVFQKADEDQPDLEDYGGYAGTVRETSVVVAIRRTAQAK